MRADWLNAALVAQYLLLAGWYACEQNWPKAGYWSGAALLGWSVLHMR